MGSPKILSGLIGISVVAWLFVIENSPQSIHGSICSWVSSFVSDCPQWLNVLFVVTTTKIVFAGILATAIFLIGYEFGTRRKSKSEHTNLSISQKRPRRSLEAKERAKLVQSVKEHLPEGGTVHIHYINQQFTTFGETLVSLFDAAGWRTQLSARQTSRIPLVQNQGVGVAAFNKHYMETVSEILRSVGITDIYNEHLKLEIPIDNPKYLSSTRKVYIYIGFSEYLD